MTDPNPAPAPSPAPAPAPAPAPTPTPAPAAWHGLPETDAESIAYIANKGWKAPADVIAGYKNAEKLIGRDPSTLVQIPRADDPDGQRALFQKLGLPETPDKYDMKVGLPEGAQPDEVFAKQMQGLFHKAGITEGQAKALVSEWNASQVVAMQAAEQNYNTQVELDKKSLLDEWKGGHDRKIMSAKAAASKLGFDAKVIDSLEKNLGYAGTWKFFADMAVKVGIGEDTTANGDRTTNPSHVLTPAEAKTQWDNQKLDPNFMKALMDKSHPGHKAAQEKQSALFAIMYPNG